MEARASVRILVGASHAISKKNHNLLYYTPMRLEVIASVPMTSLTLNVQTLQGKVVCVADGGMFFGHVNVNLKVVADGLPWHCEPWGGTTVAE